MEAVGLKRVFEFEVPKSDLISGEQSLRVAMARSGRRNMALSIFATWDNLKTASRKLASLLSHAYPDREGTGFLLDGCLMAATDAFENAINSSQPFPDRMALYLKALLDTMATNILCWETHGILDNAQTIAWPFGEIPLIEWVKRRNVERLVFTRRVKTPTAAEIEAAKFAVASMVLTYNDLLHFMRMQELSAQD